MPRPELRWPGRTSLAATAQGVPSAPSAVTSITKDAGATVSFAAPLSSGSGGPITAYVVTPYIAGVPQSATTIAAGSVGTLTGSNGNTYLQVPVTGLANATAYTFSARARNAAGDGAESGQSGANTPLSGLVFGDDFNGAAGGAVDPEWWIYNRCGFISQSEIEWYLPSQCILDGASNLQLIAQHTSHSGQSYPSDGNTVRTQPWISGACQSNARTYNPAAGNTMTFEVRDQICPDIAGGMWPGLFWLEGGFYKDSWKTDPNQTGWDNTTQAEIDVQEFHPSGGPTNYQNNTWITSSPDLFNVNTATDFSAAMHVYQVRWKPGVSTTFFRDGSQTHQLTSNIPATGANFFLLLYLQILAGTASTTQTCLIDYVRVYDQNLG